MALNGSGDHERWRLSREKYLFAFGCGLIAFEAVDYRGMWAKLTSDFVFVVIPVAVVASVVLSIVRG